MLHTVEVGFACNNACSFCAQGRLRSVSPFAERETILARIAAVPAGEPIALVGGEPTLHEDLVDLVSAARARGSSVLLQTNGRRLSVPGYADALVEAGVTALDVSLHGATEPMHDYHTATVGSFRQTVAGLGRARAARLAIGITTVVTRSSFRHLTEIVRVAHTLGARAVHFAAVTRAGSATSNAPRLVAAPGMVRPHLSRAIETATRLGLDFLAGERVSKAEARDWFAGLGSVESASSEQLQADPVRPISVVLRRRAELHQTGVG